MTQNRILQLAWEMALELWSNETMKLANDPDNEITKNVVKKYWNEVEQLEKMLKASES